ncbi:unnamed protein product [Lampetra fluviatilis]
MEATGDVPPADATKPGTRSPSPASPTPTTGGEGPPTTAGASGVPGGAAAPGSPPSPALRGGGEGSAESEAAGTENIAEQTSCPADTEEEVMEASGEKPLSATGAADVLSGAVAPRSTPSAAPSGGEEGTEKPEGSGLPGLGIEPSGTLAPEGSAEVAGGACAEGMIDCEDSEDDWDETEYPKRIGEWRKAVGGPRSGGTARGEVQEVESPRHRSTATRGDAAEARMSDGGEEDGQADGRREAGGRARSPEWLSRGLERGAPPLLLLDVRAPEAFREARVRGALSLCVPPGLMLRRLRKGSLPVRSLIPEQRHKDAFARRCKSHAVLLYGADSGDCGEDGGGGSVLALILRRLREEGCEASFLQGGFDGFRNAYPQHCEASNVCAPSSKCPCAPGCPTALSLSSLAISSDSSDGDSDVASASAEDSSSSSSSRFSSEEGSPAPPMQCPIQILPHLFLGCAQDSSNMEALAQHGIRYILNVTPNLPNTFECIADFKYKQIPISDHWNQNLSQFFPEAIAFIDEARNKQCGVLVHCLAGISRSVTVTVAYLMQKLSLPLNDAYDFVKHKKSNISPNFNFMGQLLDFERRLGLGSPAPCDNRRSRELRLFFTTPASHNAFGLVEAIEST